jgi:Arc/MetJ-type ribon-helix-helix transcriptional regulator
MTEEDLAVLDKLVTEGGYANRSDVLRAGLARLAREERENAIEAAYARGYGEQPQEEWVGEIGLAGLAAFDNANPGDPL